MRGWKRVGNNTWSSVCTRTPAMRLLVCYLFLGLVLLVRGQLLQGDLLSVSTYATCTQVPTDLPFVNGTAYNVNNSTAANGFSPCGAIPGSVTVVRLRLAPNLATGSSQLVFQLKYLIPDGDGTQYSLSNVCQGMSVGGQCQVLPQPLTITFETTRLFAAYSLYQRPKGVPYAYFAAKQDGSVLSNCGTDKFSCVGTTPCKNIDTFGQGLGKSYSSAGLFSLCPLKSESTRALLGSAFDVYQGPDGTVLTSNDQCSAITCRTPGSVKQMSNTMQVVGPNCDVYDIEGNPSAIMNVRATITYGKVSQTITLGTEQGNTIGAIDNLLFMQIVRTGFGSGVSANSLPGLIVSCASCGLDNPACTNEPFEDLPGVDDFTLYNPWEKTDIDNKCTLPLAACRQRFKPPGSPAAGMWYYVTPQLVGNYAYGVCNSNGFWSYDAVAGQGNNAAGLQNKICLSILDADSVCIPGTDQLTQFGLPQPVTYTPCLVEQLLASRVACYIDQAQCTLNAGFLPLDYNVAPQKPQYFRHKGRLYRNALDTATKQGSLELALYISQEFLMTVTNIASGTFVENSVNCAGTERSEGSLTYCVQNQDLTSGATYTVTATFTLPSDGNYKLLVLVGSSILINGSHEIDQPITVAAGSTNCGLFSYRYNGDLRPDSMSVHLVLSATTASQQTFVFAQADTVCATVAGVTGTPPGFLLYDYNYSTTPGVADVCHWANPFCFSGSWWQTILKVLAWILVSALILWLMYTLIAFTLAEKGLAKVTGEGLDVAKNDELARQEAEARKRLEKQRDREDLADLIGTRKRR